MASYLYNLLALFTPEVGLSSEEIVESLQRTRVNPDRRELDGLRQELSALYRDARTDWIQLLQNEEDEIYAPANQEEAREFITKRIWNILFPEEADAPPTTS